jgi:hypothetical protein
MNNLLKSYKYHWIDYNKRRIDLNRHHKLIGEEEKYCKDLELKRK